MDTTEIIIGATIVILAAVAGVLIVKQTIKNNSTL